MGEIEIFNHLLYLKPFKCKQMSSCTLKNVNYKVFIYKSCIFNSYMCKQDLALNNPQGLICYKTQPNQIIVHLNLHVCAIVSSEFPLLHMIQSNINNFNITPSESTTGSNGNGDVTPHFLVLIIF